MLIDWFTVCAQAINFLILVWLLKRFLYRPVLAAIDAREKKITERLQSAAQQQAQAQSERDDFQRRNAALDQDRERVLRVASEAAAQERDRLMEGAREEARALRERLLGAVANEREELGRRIQRQTRLEVLALARRVLQDLAGAEIEQRMVEVFLARIRALPPEQLQQLRQPKSSAPRAVSNSAVVVRSAFELTAAQQEAIAARINETRAAPGEPVDFVISPELVCGIELTVSGIKLAWSVTDYLTSVSQELLALIEPTNGAHESVQVAEASHARG